jgi:hypothetical protein
MNERTGLRAIENRVLRRIFGPRGRKQWEAGGECIMRSFIVLLG